MDCNRRRQKINTNLFILHLLLTTILPQSPRRSSTMVDPAAPLRRRLAWRAADLLLRWLTTKFGKGS